MGQFHGFRCKMGIDENNNVVYRAACPIKDIGFDNSSKVLESFSAKEAEVSRYGYTILSYYQLKAIDAELADYLMNDAFADSFVRSCIEIEAGRRNLFGPNPDYCKDYHNWWLANREELEAEIDAYFAEHPFTR